MRVLVYGAGVIGQIYAGRLAHAAHDVTLLARGARAVCLADRGVVLRQGAARLTARPVVTSRLDAADAYDVVLVTVRRDQLDEALPHIAKLHANRVVFLLNQCVGLADVAERVGQARTVFAFPGVGGYVDDTGAVRYIHIAQQKTTVGSGAAEAQPVADLMRNAQFPVDLTLDIDAWLKTHVIFISAVGGAILRCGGDSARLAADRQGMSDMVAAVAEGFGALGRRGVGVTPTPLRFMFTTMPRLIAVAYWQRQLAGPVGTVAISPHVRTTRDTEFPTLCGDARRLVAGDGRTPHLDLLLGS